jgi:SAM-dependent methyltransferase
MSVKFAAPNVDWRDVTIPAPPTHLEVPSPTPGLAPPVAADRFAVLPGRDDIFAAEHVLRARGLDFAGSAVYPEHVRPDPLKSWDVLRTIELVEARCAADDAVLDLGSFACQILPALDRLGFRNLHGIELDARVADMPGAARIDYRIGDMMATPWADGSFRAVTAISTIEHGFDLDRLLGEVSRLLGEGGIFSFSTDYWPQKIDTTGIVAFGMPWQIFSAQDIEAFVERAAAFGLEPVTPIGPHDLRSFPERTINWMNRQYTFIHGVFEKRSAA